MDLSNFERLSKLGAFEPKTESSTVRPPDFSDAGNAAVFVREHKGDLIFTDALGWLSWNGTVWERGDHMAEHLAIEFTGRMFDEAASEYRDAQSTFTSVQIQVAEGTATKQDVSVAKEAVKAAKEYLDHAKQSRSAFRIKAILTLAKPSLVIKADKLDGNSAELNTPAGIVDLNTGSIRKHDRTAYCTKITSAAPGSAGAAMWMDFLETITGGDSSLIGFLQLVAGMALHGKVYHEGLILAFGSGRNGKSTYFNGLLAVLGDYAGTIDVSVLTTDRQNRGAALATLRGKRLVVAGELEEGKRLSVSTLKQITSTDAISIEEKYKQPETVTPTHSLVLFTNHLPRVGSMDNGTWRRLQVVPFNASIPEKSTIANFGDVLAREAGPAILAWAIQGAVNFARNGYKLDIPAAVEEVTDEYRQRENWLDNFIEECCVREPDARAGAAELYGTYKEWSAQNGDYTRRLNDFNTAMESAGYEKRTPKGKKVWIGIRVDNRARYSQVL